MNGDDDRIEKISATDDENTNVPHLSKLTDQQNGGDQVADQHRRLVGGDEGGRDRPALTCVRRRQRQTNHRNKHHCYRETPIRWSRYRGGKKNILRHNGQPTTVSAYRGHIRRRRNFQGVFGPRSLNAFVHRSTSASCSGQRGAIGVASDVDAASVSCCQPGTSKWK